MLTLILVIIVFVIRLFFLFLSKKNEKIIIQEGAIEYNKTTTKFLIFFHTIFYFMVLGKYFFINKWIITIDSLFYLGIVLYAFSFFIFFLVARNLGKYWTVTLYLCPNHKKIDTFLLRNFKHPNYYFNIIPELISVVLIFHTWLSLIMIYPFYLITLYCRIKEENKFIAKLQYCYICSI